MSTSDVTQTTEPLPVRCWCALTREGNIVPWMCSTDRERVLDDIRAGRMPWTAIAVIITPDEEDG